MATYMEAIYQIPYKRLRPYTVGGDLDTVVAQLEAIVAAGVDQLVLLPATREPVSTIQQLGVAAARLQGQLSPAR
jgi:hypothetical protein